MLKKLILSILIGFAFNCKTMEKVEKLNRDDMVQLLQFLRWNNDFEKRGGIKNITAKDAEFIFSIDNKTELMFIKKDLCNQDFINSQKYMEEQPGSELDLIFLEELRKTIEKIEKIYVLKFIQFKNYEIIADQYTNIFWNLKHYFNKQDVIILLKFLKDIHNSLSSDSAENPNEEIMPIEEWKNQLEKIDDKILNIMSLILFLIIGEQADFEETYNNSPTRIREQFKTILNWIDYKNKDV